MTGEFVVTCRWVPGTLDQVRVSSGRREEILDIQQIERRFGRAALEALYLKGNYTNDASTDLLNRPDVASR